MKTLSIKRRRNVHRDQEEDKEARDPRNESRYGGDSMLALDVAVVKEKDPRRDEGERRFDDDDPARHGESDLFPHRRISLRSDQFSDIEMSRTMSLFHRCRWHSTNIVIAIVVIHSASFMGLFGLFGSDIVGSSIHERS